jgi:hypothetical protein
VLPPRNAVGRDHFSLATLASASPRGVGPLLEDNTPSKQPVRVGKLARANVPERRCDRPVLVVREVIIVGRGSRFCSLGMRSSSKTVWWPVQVPVSVAPAESAGPFNSTMFPSGSQI